MTGASSSPVVYPGVELAADCQLGPFVILGEGAQQKPSPPPTIIGPAAVIRSHTVIYFGNVIGQGLQTGHHVLIRELNRIGDRVSIGSGSVVEHHVTIGHGARIHSQAFIPEYSVLEDECWIGPNVVLTNARYPASPGAKHDLRGVVVKAKARIGANSTILPGVVVGEQALVGAGSVVTKDVGPGQVVAGNPAKIINYIANLPY